MLILKSQIVSNHERTLMFYYLGLYFVVQELLLEFGQGVVSAVIVQVQRVQHIPGKKAGFIQV